MHLRTSSAGSPSTRRNGVAAATLPFDPWVKCHVGHKTSTTTKRVAYSPLRRLGTKKHAGERGCRCNFMPRPRETRTWNRGEDCHRKSSRRSFRARLAHRPNFNDREIRIWYDTLFDENLEHRVDCSILAARKIFAMRFSFLRKWNFLLPFFYNLCLGLSPFLWCNETSRVFILLSTVRGFLFRNIHCSFIWQLTVIDNIERSRRYILFSSGNISIL